MALTHRQIERVRQTFTVIEAQQNTFSQVFFEHLFRLAPEARVLFGSDLHTPTHSLFHMLRVAVNSLPNLNLIGPAMRSLGARHQQRGVEPGHYQQFGAALMLTLGDLLGDDHFDTATQTAWGLTFEALASTALRGANYDALPPGTVPNPAQD